MNKRKKKERKKGNEQLDSLFAFYPLLANLRQSYILHLHHPMIVGVRWGRGRRNEGKKEKNKKEKKERKRKRKQKGKENKKEKKTKCVIFFPRNLLFPSTSLSLTSSILINDVHSLEWVGDDEMMRKRRKVKRNKETNPFCFFLNQYHRIGVIC